MQKIDTTQIVDPTSLQPFTGRSLEFLQDSLDIDKAGIIKAFITQTVGSYSLTVPYVISGCVVSDSGKDVTAGEIFYGGKFYETTDHNLKKGLYLSLYCKPSHRIFGAILNY